MEIDGAIVKEQGIVFGIIIVKPSAMQDASVAAKTREAFQAGIRDFFGIPLILACRDSSGGFQYQGRRDIVDFLASVPPSSIPWKRYTLL